MRYGQPGNDNKLGRVLVGATGSRAVRSCGPTAALGVPSDGPLSPARRRWRSAGFGANTGDGEASDNEALLAGPRYLETIMDLGIGISGSQFWIAAFFSGCALDE